MIIAVTIQVFNPFDREGTGYFTMEVVSRLALQHPDAIFYILSDLAESRLENLSANIKSITIKPNRTFSLMGTVFYNRRLSSVLKNINADILINADGITALKTTIPQLLLIQDLAFLYHPEFQEKSQLAYLKKNMARFLEKAKVVSTISGFSKEDICKHYGTDEQKIHVAGYGINELLKPFDPEEREKVKEQYAEGCEYFIYAGSYHPQKNLLNLLKAFSVFKKKQKSSMKLIICGQKSYGSEDFLNLLKTFKFRDEVKLIDEADDKERAALLASAYAMVYPSFFEGFGFPPLEALQCHVPAIVSRTSALPEVGGDAYLYVNPDNFEDIAAKMMLLFKDETLRNKLIENGKERVKLFSWEQTTQKMWECIELASRPE